MNKILLMRTDRIGDVVLTTPSIKLIRDKYPSAHISFMATPLTAELVQNNPYLNEVILYDKKGKHRHWLKTFLFARDLRKKRFDISIAFNPSNRNHWISFLAKIPKRIGYNRKASKLLTHIIEDKKMKGAQSEAFYNEDLLQNLNIQPVKSKEMLIPLNPEAEKNVSQLIKRHLNNQPFVVLNLSASCPSKVWPLENYALLSQLIVEKLQMKIVCIGNENDCQSVSKLSPTPMWMVAETLSLIELSILLKRSNALISGDTGPQHIASAVGTPVISIFGRTLLGLNPKRWAPIKGQNKLFHKNIGCNPCLAHLCQLDFDCQKATKVEEVFNAVKSYT